MYVPLQTEKEVYSMLNSNISTDLLELKDVNIDSVENYSDLKVIKCHLESKEDRICPRCGSKHVHIHDHRTVYLKDVDMAGKQVVLNLKKKRYKCQDCKKIYTENNQVHPKRYRSTSRLICRILDSFRETVPASHIARENHISTTTALRYFDLIGYSCRQLPSVLSIDEFKGNANRTKYQTLMVDVESHLPIDVLPDRYESNLIKYFLGFPREMRMNVKYFVQDMNPHFKRVAETCFPNAIIVADKFHVFRQVYWALERVRKNEQKQLSDKWRKYFKRSKSILSKDPSKLEIHEKEKMSAMFVASPYLERAYDLKNEFISVINSKNSDEANENLTNWISKAISSEITEFESAVQAMVNWSTEIINSFDVAYTNGITEGLNNKTKVLKRACYGIQRYDRLKNRILYCSA